MATPYLGKRVTVVVDRPHGSVHPRHGLRYEADYGCLRGTLAPDGDELDA